jgi:type IV pilus assembly protein PilN
VSATPVAIEKPSALWSSIPGWGIAANLIPPELLAARQLKFLRKLLAIGIAALLLIAGFGYFLAATENSRAASELAAARAQTEQLLDQGRGYAEVIAIQGSITEVETQLAQVMSGDVDLAALMGELSSSLPETMTISQESITVSLAAIAGSATDAAAPSGLDTSGIPRIGAITIDGTGQTMDDLPDYIDRLRAINGLVDVLPVSNSLAGASSTEFHVTAGLTNAALSHRFDVGR